MTSKIAGAASGNAIIPYSQTTKKTKQIALTVTGTNWTTSSAVGLAYADSLGNWRLVLNISGTISSASTGFTGTISGITFKNAGIGQAASAYLELTATADREVTIARCNSNTSDFVVAAASSFDRIRFSADVELESKPSWADANMEGQADASVYVDPATATTSGTLSAGSQEIGGVKDFKNGVKFDSAIESTVDSGVTIDGVLLKDNKVSSSLGFLTSTQTIDMGTAGAATHQFTDGSMRLAVRSIYLCHIEINENSTNTASASFIVHTNTGTGSSTSGNIASQDIVNIGGSSINSVSLLYTGGFLYVQANATNAFSNDPITLSITKLGGLGTF